MFFSAVKKYPAAVDVCLSGVQKSTWSLTMSGLLSGPTVYVYSFVLLSNRLYLFLGCQKFAQRHLMSLLLLSVPHTSLEQFQNTQLLITCLLFCLELLGNAYINRGHALLFLFSFCHGLNLFVQKTWRWWTCLFCLPSKSLKFVFIVSVSFGRSFACWFILGLLRLLWISKMVAETDMTLARSAKTDYIFFSTFKNSRPPAMSVLLVSVSSYPSNRIQKPWWVSHMSAALCGVAEHIISKSQAKYRTPSSMFCSLLSALQNIRIQSPHGSESDFPASDISSVVLGLKYSLLLFLPDKKQRTQLVMAVLLNFVEMVYLCLKIRAPRAMWLWFCSDFSFSTPLLSQNPKDNSKGWMSALLA